MDLPAGLAFSPLGVVVLAGSSLANLLLRRYRWTVVAACAQFLSACGFTLMAWASPGTPYLSRILPSLLILGLGTVNFKDLGIAVADDVTSRAVEKSSFENMRAHESNMSGTRPDPVGGDTRIMRSGTPNEWLQWITSELEQKFLQGKMPSVAERYGYDLAPRQPSAG
jgi:hypothetical protein